MFEVNHLLAGAKLRKLKAEQVLLDITVAEKLLEEASLKGKEWIHAAEIELIEQNFYVVRRHSESGLKHPVMVCRYIGPRWKFLFGGSYEPLEGTFPLEYFDVLISA